MDDKLEEKNKRFDFVWGIILAAILGFLLNLLANVYYDLFIVKTVLWEKVNQEQVFIIILLLLGLVGFLGFLIDDYRNEMKISRNFLQRYWQYFFYKFTPGKIMRWFFGGYILLIAFAFLLVISVALFYASSNLILSISPLLLVALKIYFEVRRTPKKVRWYTLLTIILLFLVQYLIFSLVLWFLIFWGYYEIDLINCFIVPSIIAILSIVFGFLLAKKWWNFVYIEKKHWIFRTKLIKNKWFLRFFDTYL